MSTIRQIHREHATINADGDGAWFPEGPVAAWSGQPSSDFAAVDFPGPHNTAFKAVYGPGTVSVEQAVIEVFSDTTATNPDNAYALVYVNVGDIVFASMTGTGDFDHGGIGGHGNIALVAVHDFDGAGENEAPIPGAWLRLDGPTLRTPVALSGSVVATNRGWLQVKLVGTVTNVAFTFTMRDALSMTLRVIRRGSAAAKAIPGDEAQVALRASIQSTGAGGGNFGAGPWDSPSASEQRDNPPPVHGVGRR